MTRQQVCAECHHLPVCRLQLSETREPAIRGPKRREGSKENACHTARQELPSAHQRHPLASKRVGKT